MPTPPVPLPHPSTRIPKHLHDSIPEDPTRFLQPSADVHSARPHPGVDALLKTNGEVQFERTVDSLSKLVFGLLLSSFLAVCRLLCGSPVFKDLYVACTLRCCAIIVDLRERIKSEFGVIAILPTLYSEPHACTPERKTKTRFSIRSRVPPTISCGQKIIQERWATRLISTSGNEY